MHFTLILNLLIVSPIQFYTELYSYNHCLVSGISGNQIRPNSELGTEQKGELALEVTQEKASNLEW